MKKGFVVVLVLTCMLLVSSAFARDYFNSYTLTRDWGTSTTEWPNPRQIYNIAYNETSAASTGHLYVNDGQNIRIANRNDGSLVDTDFPTASSYDRLTSYTNPDPNGLDAGFYFSVGVADDGAIYATDLNRGLILYRWANETATPTSQTVANLNFTRQINCKGSGVNTTILAIGGGDTGPMDILTTADGLNFSVADTIPSAGKTLVGYKDANTVFGGGPWASSPVSVGDDGAANQGWPDRWNKSGGVWTRDGGFVAWSVGSGFNYDLGGDWIEVDSSDPRYPGNGLLFSVKYAPLPDWLVLMNDTTGWGEGRIGLDQDITVGNPAFYYGQGCTDSTERDVYYGIRAQWNSSRGHYGRYSVNYVGSGVSDWELY